ncbi:MAG: hypothetical protein WD889_01785 [Candidatus Colwellbacteria bacterium]
MEKLSEPITEGLIHCPVHGWTRGNEHHVIPTSRGGEGSSKGNIHEEICITCHQYYHFLFANMLPSETMEHLVTRIWNGQIRWIFIFLWQRLLTRTRKMLGLSPREKGWGTPLQPLQNGRLHRSLEGERRLLNQIRELGLATHDYAVVNERTKQIVRFVKAGAGHSRKDLLEEEDLEWYESIRPIVMETFLHD